MRKNIKITICSKQFQKEENKIKKRWRRKR